MYQLGSVVLPAPKRMTKETMETSVEHLLLFGKTTKHTKHRKYRYVLEYALLPVMTVNSILSEYEINASRIFTVTEDNLSIGPSDVLVDVDSRDYPPSGVAYVENMRLILTEVF